jgi:hypothetical protein
MHGLRRGNQNGSRRHGGKTLNRENPPSAQKKTAAEKTKPGIAKGESG